MAIDSFIAQGNAQLAAGAKANSVQDAPVQKVVQSKGNTLADQKAAQTAKGTTTPTVMSDENIRSNVIPNIQNQASQMLDYDKNPLYLRPGENADAYKKRVQEFQTPDGSQDTNPKDSSSEDESDGYDSVYKSVFGDSQEGDTNDFYDSELSLLDRMGKTSDSRTANQLASITADYAQQRQDVQASQQRNSASANTALMKAGSRYAPQSAGQMMNAQDRGYIRSIGTIDLQEQQAKNDALAAQSDQDYKLLGEKLGVLKDKRQEKLDVVNKLYDSVVEQKKQNQKDVNSVLSSAAENGAPKDVQSQIATAKSMGEAIQAAGTWLQTSNDPTTSKFLNYQRQATLAGQVPLSYDDWYAKDQKQQANQKYAEAYASEKAKNDADTAASGGSATTSNPAYAGVLQTILGSGTFTAAQTKAVTNAINNGEDPFTVIKNQAKNIMGSTEGTSLTKYETAKSSLEKIQENLKDYYANGGQTNVFSGNYEKVINKLGSVNDPKLVDLATQIQANLQVYRNAVSGTAYSAQEGADIATIFPGINKSQGLNEAILKGRMTAFDSTIDSQYESTLGSAYNTLKTLDKQSTAGNHPIVQQQQQEEDDLTTSIVRIRDTNSQIYEAAMSMWSSLNPETGQPYTVGDVYAAYPELNK